MNTAQGTPQVTDEQIITVFHLVLQVYCSPSLKELLHNPVMPLLARIIERRGSTLCAHSGVCACVCVWWLYVHTHACLCVACAWVCGCVCMHISVCICVSAIRIVDTNLQVYAHASVTTQVQLNIWQLLIIFLYMFTADKWDVTVTHLTSCTIRYW